MSGANPPGCYAPESHRSGAHTERTNYFEDTELKQRGLELMLGA